MKRAAAESEGERRASTTTRNESRQNTGGSAGRSGPVASLHQAMGNQAVRKHHENGTPHSTLEVSIPNDRSELEARRVAELVVGDRTPESTPSGEGDAAEPPDSTRPTSSAPSPGTPDERAVPSRSVTWSGERLDALRGRGQPLPRSVRSVFEQRFGANFSSVRIHTDRRASEMARSLNARAFTVGNDIVFDQNAYAPGTRQGKQLLAHEQTHVVQRSEGIHRQDCEPDRPLTWNDFQGSPPSRTPLEAKT